MKDGNIAILMATYNGEPFIRQQIDSILQQTYRHWHLYIHDDGSTDGTIDIIKSYSAKYADKITLLDYPQQGGAYENFISMMARVDSRYFMFSDQDDVWHRDKIGKSWLAMQKLEKEHTDRPLIVHSDLRVVNSNGEILSPSFWNAAGMYPKMFKTFEQRISNIVTGCTMLFNDNAKAAALDRIPDGSPLHDEWVTICSCAKGGIVYSIDEPLIDYRQHDNNVLGAANCYNSKTLKHKLKTIGKTYQANKANYRILRSAGYGSKRTYIKNKIRNLFVYHLKYAHQQ